MSIGGLQFVRTNDVAMESEDLRIALDKVSVRYQFANVTNKPVTLTVAFPLPDIDLSEADNIALPSNDPVNFVDFETKVDGSPAPLTIDQRAMIGDKDVGAQLRQFKLPLLPIGSREIRVSRPARSDPDAAGGRRASDACRHERQRSAAICARLGHQDLRRASAGVPARAHRRR